MYSDRFKAVRVLSKKTLDAFAKSINISKGALSKIENDISTPSANTIVSLSKRYNVSPNWLLTGDGEMFFQELSPISEQSCQILTVVGEIAAGSPVEISGEPLASFTVGHSVVENVNNVYCFQVNGQSMEPDIKHGDLVIIKKQFEWSGSEGKVCAVRVDGEVTLKKVSHDSQNKLLFLSANNQAYAPIVINHKQNSIELIGILDVIIRKTNQ